MTLCAEGKASNTFAKHIEDCKVGTEDWLVQNIELSTDFDFVNDQIHKIAVFMLHLPTNVTRTGRLRIEPKRIETIDVPSCPKQVGLKQINHGKVIRIIMVGYMHKTYGTHQSTTIGGVYFNRSNLLVSFVDVNPLFSNMSERAREARNKSQFIALH